MNAPFRTHPLGGRILDDVSAVTVLPSVAARRGRVSKISDERVRELFTEGLDDGAIATTLGCSRQTIYLRRRAMRLLHRKGRRPPQAADRPTFHSRHEPHSLDDKIARMPPINHPALSEARTIYPLSVLPVRGLLNLLVAGDNSWKIGGKVTKGAWRGFPIYTLTLQERATCPTSCAHWRSCYGNAMNWAKRVQHGPELEERLGFEVGLLSYRHPEGFAVRLHVLGDFYSVGYVHLWAALLDSFPNLHVFGFSARTDADDDVARALSALIDKHWPRFAVRTSNGPSRTRSTVTIEHPVQKPADAIVCPQQTGRTASCGTCALCWSTDRRIAFLRH